jgi:RNA-directed DNA polymerase
VAQAQRYVAVAYSVVVDLDLEKFFDRVNHDRLMARVAARVTDKRVLKLIRAFLKSGVMEDGLVSPVDEGTPQGGPLSPLLSNLVLDELDRELTRRGHRFCRYADDCNIYVRSRRAGERVYLGEPVPDQEAAAEGQRGQERDSATGGAQVPGFQHLE